MTDDRHEPAFPVHTGYTGLTKREYIAIMAMQAIIPENNNSDWAERVAAKSIKMADALLKELN